MSIFRALQHREFRLYFFGQFVSQIGTWMQLAALGWLVHRLTGEPKWLGIIAFASQIPMFILSPLGGVIADRFSARRVSLMTQGLLLLQAVGMTLLARQDHPPIQGVLALSVILGMLNAFDLAARNVLVALCVPNPDLPNAIALSSTLFQSSRILGPALAGIVVATLGESWCFLMNALSYLAALGTLLAMTPGTQHVRSVETNLKAHFSEGIQFIAAHRQLRLLFVFMGVIVLLGMPYNALMPIFADQILDVGPKGLGWLMGACGVGATLGSLLLASLPRAEQLPRVLMFAKVLTGLSLMIFAQATRFETALVFVGFASMALVVANTGNNTMVSMMVPQGLRGRVISLYSAIFVGAMPLGALVAGYGAQILGAPRTLTVGALGCVIAAVAFARWYPAAGQPGPLHLPHAQPRPEQV